MIKSLVSVKEIGRFFHFPYNVFSIKKVLNQLFLKFSSMIPKISLLSNYKRFIMCLKGLSRGFWASEEYELTSTMSL